MITMITMMKRRHYFLSVFPMLPIINFLFFLSLLRSQTADFDNNNKIGETFLKRIRDRKIDFF